MTNKVVTFDGTEALRSDCRYIKGEFYIKNKQCFQFDGVWYRITSNLVALNHTTGKYILLKDGDNLTNGIVGYDEVNKEFILGYFERNPYVNATVFMASGKTEVAMNHLIIPNDIFVEVEDGSGFVQKTHPHINHFKKAKVNFGNHNYGWNLPYGFRHIDESVIDSITDLSHKRVDFTENITSKKRKGIVRYIMDDTKKYLPYSFGLEFETYCGRIPAYRMNESGLVALRDGSISGIEYATIPLTGSAGISILELACNYLAKFTSNSVNESLHLHLGNTITTPAYIGTLYTLLAILEKEFFLLFPRYYEQTSKFKSRGRDYNRPLKSNLVSASPTETFQNITYYLAAGKKYEGFGQRHPSDPSDEHKWQIEQRYHWVNFIPMLFGDSKTIEFRVHTPTNDIVKVVNWILICSAVLKYTEMFVKNKLNLNDYRNLTLKTVINEAYNYTLATYLNRYIEERKVLRRQMDTAGDYTGEAELLTTYTDFSF